MVVDFRAGVTVAVTVFLSSVVSLVCAFPATLTLERAFPTNNGVELAQLRGRDTVRHGRMLQSIGGIIDFPLLGTYDPFLVGLDLLLIIILGPLALTSVLDAQLYYTKVRLGTPPRDFYVQIDTGSDVLWISCSSCDGCPATSGLQIQLSFYDPGISSTASMVPCADQLCTLGTQSSDSVCSAQSNQCGYIFQYGDGSGTSGYYVSDLMHFDVVLDGSVTSNSSAAVVFGCSISQTGDLTKSDRAVDGIFGFGQQQMSIVSQLSSRGIAPNVFSHCLKGDDSGGGILVLGEILDPNIVFSPLVSSQLHYNLNLQSISVNGQVLSIDPAVFTTSSNQGTIIDSGTTLAYLAEEAYNHFVTAITSSVSQSAQSVISKGNHCYLTTSSVTDIFPQVSLNFAGGAAMILRPKDYLIQQNSIGGAAVWCIGFQKIQGQGITILGDLVLKDKIFVYDLAGKRIGWTNYDCSTSVNVSTTARSGRSEYVNAGQLSDNSSIQSVSFRLVSLAIGALLVHISLFIITSPFL